MSNRKDLKKDINEATNDFAGLCVAYLETHTGANALAVDELIDKAADLLDESLSRINKHTHVESGKETREYFIAIEEEFDEGLNKLYDDFKSATA